MADRQGFRLVKQRRNGGLYSQLLILVYNKLVTTALRYTPVVLEHHCPYRTQQNGKVYVLFLV